MAANTPQRVYSDGTTNRVCIYRVFGITAADTIQLSNDFKNVTDARFIPTSGTAAPAAAAISGNTLATISNAGLAADDGYLIAYGSGVQQ